VNAAHTAQLPVVGCWPYEQGKSGFALPIFVHPENASILLIQEVREISGKIGAFKILAETDLPLLATQNAVEAVVGGNPIYAFVADDGNAYAGDAIQLQTLLRDFSAKNPSRYGTNLQIAELIGSETDRKIARAKMRHAVAEHAGANAAADFYTGALRSILWTALVQGAPNEEIAGRILNVRSRLDASVDDGALVFDLEAIPPADRATISIEKLEARILSEFELLPTKTLSEPSPESNNSDVENSQREVAELLQRIGRCGRQEERIAIVMDSIIANRSAGLSALLQYGTDRAKFANSALDLLRGIFFQRNNLASELLAQNKSTSQSELFLPNLSLGTREAPLPEIIASHDPELMMALLIPRLFTRQYPMSRGELLFYLSRHLAKWPKVNQAIRQSLNRTASIYVDDWREAIEGYLSNPPLARSV
jgi:hypothetical protein